MSQIKSKYEKLQKRRWSGICKSNVSTGCGQSVVPGQEGKLWIIAATVVPVAVLAVVAFGVIYYYTYDTYKRLCLILNQF